jgi:hypothetical protein
MISVRFRLYTLINDRVTHIKRERERAHAKQTADVSRMR